MTNAITGLGRTMRQIWKFTKFVTILSIVLWNVACHESGTWDDDSCNWNRIFGSSVPKDVKVLRSRVWRSPHWTFEYECYFRLAAGSKFVERFCAEHGLQRSNSTQGPHYGARQDNPMRPDWFVSKESEAYDRWVCDSGDRVLTVHVDRETRDVYVYGEQL